MEKLMSTFTAKDGKFISDMNKLSSEQQRKLLLKKTKEFMWDYHDSKMDKYGRANKNFHIIVNNLDIRIQREEYITSLGKTIIKWTLWNKTHRIEGTYGELIYQLINFINAGV